MLPTKRQIPGFPTCIALSLEFNRHAVYYLTVQQWIDDERNSGREIPWASDEERDRAIATDSVWMLNWNPSTPVGSCEVAASSFDALMAAVKGHGIPSEVETLRAEVERLKAGRFTSEEIHAICHNLHGTVDAQAFADGCAAEQRRIYGCAPDRDALERIRDDDQPMTCRRCGEKHIGPCQVPA